MTRVLSLVRTLPRGEANIFPEYIFPAITEVAQDEVDFRCRRTLACPNVFDHYDALGQIKSLSCRRSRLISTDGLRASRLRGKSLISR